MSTTVTYKAKWTGKDPTRVIKEPLGEKVDVQPDETVEVEQSIAKRLMREPNWVVEDEPKVTKLEDGEKAASSAAPKAAKKK